MTSESLEDYNSLVVPLILTKRELSKVKTCCRVTRLSEYGSVLTGCANHQSMAGISYIFIELSLLTRSFSPFIIAYLYIFQLISSPGPVQNKYTLYLHESFKLCPTCFQIDFVFSLNVVSENLH